MSALNRKKLHFKHKKLYVALLVLLILALIVIFFPRLLDLFPEFKKQISPWFQIVEAIGIITTLFFTLWQLVGSKEISRATFILELNKSYVENKEYMNIYDVLQRELDGTTAAGSPGNITENDGENTKNAGENTRGSGDISDRPAEITKGAISNYLTFFETIYILNKRGVLPFEIVDDLFAYRFFLAVHSKLFQDMKLKAQPENFKNIFKLEKEWLDYRVRIGKTSKEDVEKACKYWRAVYAGEESNSREENAAALKGSVQSPAESGSQPSPEKGSRPSSEGGSQRFPVFVDRPLRAMVADDEKYKMLLR